MQISKITQRKIYFFWVRQELILVQCISTKENQALRSPNFEN